MAGVMCPSCGWVDGEHRSTCNRSVILRRIEMERIVAANGGKCPRYAPGPNGGVSGYCYKCGDPVSTGECKCEPEWFFTDEEEKVVAHTNRVVTTAEAAREWDAMTRPPKGR